MNLIKSVSYEWLIGMRYTHTNKYKDNNAFISFISFISMIGIALGVAALIIVLSVMNGFQKEVRDRMLSVLSHIEIFDASGTMKNWENIAKQVFKNKNVIGVAPYITAQAIMIRDDIMRGVLIRGVLPDKELEVSDITSQIKQGKFTNLREGKFNIILGQNLAQTLHVNLGDKVMLIIPQQGQITTTTNNILPHIKEFTVVGIFEVGHHEFDASLSFVQLMDAKKVFNLNGPSGLRLRIKNILEAPKIADVLVKTLNGNFYLRDWSQQNSNWFAAVKIEKRMMFMILLLIIAVAAFNLVSTLVMTITSKRADIAILRTLGASPGGIMRIFIIQGVSIGLIGTAMGIFFGVLIAKNIDIIVPCIERLLQVEFLPKNIYIISELPSDLIWSDVWSIGSIAIILAFLATLYPSWTAANIKPAQALRYE